MMIMLYWWKHMFMVQLEVSFMLVVPQAGVWSRNSGANAVIEELVTIVVST